MTVTAATTKVTRDGYDSDVSCHGLNHRDRGVIARCDACLAWVVRVLDERGYTRKIVNMQRFSGDTWATESFYCWSPDHTCDREMAALVAAEKAAAIEAGQIVKDSKVVVTRGRKVPKGTTGVVFWLGTDGYGTEKVGIRCDDGAKVFTALKNCDPAR